MMKKPISWIVALTLAMGSIALLSLSMNKDHGNEEATISQELAYNWQGGKCGDGSSEKASTQEEEAHSKKCTCDQCKGKDGKCKPDCKCPHHAKADKDGDGKVDKHKHDHKCGGGKCGGGKCGCGGKCGM